VTVQEGELQANGLRFRYLAAGDAGAPVALLLHGFPEGAESWLPQLEGLAGAGRRAVAPDLRGYGGSDAPQGTDAYAMPHLLADVGGMIRALGVSQVDLAGHDWGALVGWSLTSRHPDLVRTWTALSVPHPTALARATGLDAGGAADPDQQARSSYVGFFHRAGRSEEALLENAGERLHAMYRLGPNPDAVPEAMRRKYVEGFLRAGRMTAALDYYRANLHPAAYAAFPPCPRSIATSTLLIWGAQDPALGRRAVEETASEMAGPYRLEVIEDAGHWLQFERPSEVSRLLVEHMV
jgi:pimeloyl-ACP methyl ester carboxylesterase